MDGNEIAWGAKCPPGLMIRRATDDDLAARRAIFADSRDLERQLSGWPDGLWTSFITHQFDLREADWRQTYPDAEWLLLMDAGSGKVIGAMTLSLSRPVPDPTPAFGHIVDIAFVAAYRNRGLGSGLLKALARAARARKLAGLRLSVRNDNPAARRLYERLGFRPEGSGDGTITVMQRKK